MRRDLVFHNFTARLANSVETCDPTTWGFCEEMRAMWNPFDINLKMQLTINKYNIPQILWALQYSQLKISSLGIEYVNSCSSWDESIIWRTWKIKTLQFDRVGLRRDCTLYTLYSFAWSVKTIWSLKHLMKSFVLLDLITSSVFQTTSQNSKQLHTSQVIT